jgi:small subunit ribosomal protein S7
MARKRDIVKREVNPDPRYGDRQVAKFVNGLMLDVKKVLLWAFSTELWI